MTLVNTFGIIRAAKRALSIDCLTVESSIFSVLEQLHGKTQVMKLLAHADPNVRYHALLAVQKLMVHNWEYLGVSAFMRQPLLSFLF